MKKYKAYYWTAGILFTLVALLHAVRAVMQWPMNVGPVDIPTWFSWTVFVLLGYLAIRGFWAATRK